MIVICFNRKQAENDYDVVTGTRYAGGGGVRGVHIAIIVASSRSS